MKKRKRNKYKHKLKQKAHTVYFPRVGHVQLAPGRESQTPFCAYYGPLAETCTSTVGLEVVSTLPSRPPIVYMACPLHYGAVSHMVQTFLEELEKSSQ